MQGQPGLHSSKFKASQSYMVRSCLRKLHIGGKRGNREKGMRTLELRKRNTSNDEGDIGGVCSQTDQSASGTTPRTGVRHDSGRTGGRSKQKARVAGNILRMDTEEEYPGKRGFNSLLVLISHSEAQET